MNTSITVSPPEVEGDIAFQKPVSNKSLAMVRTRAVVGVEAVPVMVEVHLANGLPAFSTVGLPETAVKESKDRVRGAILNSVYCLLLVSFLMLNLIIVRWLAS